MSDDLERRLARLEAREAVLATFNSYLYFLDIGYPDELVQLFEPDAVLHLVNFPPGTMRDRDLHGHDEIARLYVDHTTHEPRIHGGHHSANVAVHVAPDGSSAELSAYFLTTGPGVAGAQGGQYQLRLRPDGARWRIREMNIISGWGWRPSAEASTRTTEPVPATTAWREGRPVVW